MGRAFSKVNKSTYTNVLSGCLVQTEISHCPQSDYLANSWPAVYFFIYLWHPELTQAQ